MSGEFTTRRKRALVRWCDLRLRAEYGEKTPPRRRPDPLTELILTVLSQNTNDQNRDRAFAELKRRFPSWDKALAAPAEEIEAAIRGGGLARQKAARIKTMLETIRKQEGELSLRRVCRRPQAEALDYLRSFKGVGAKTAACVLLFACGRPVFPVDTHVFRVAGRLGLLEKSLNAEKAHGVMAELVADEAVYRLHKNLIEHGRQRCHPRKPECGACCLNSRCPSAFRVQS